MVGINVSIIGAIMICWCGSVLTLSHYTTLMWSQKKTLFGEVSIMGFQGDPDVWVNSGRIEALAYGSPLDFHTKYKSHRIALAYRYSTQNLYWSDRGLKNIYKIELADHNPGVYHNYTTSVWPVYHGSSREVNGIAVDWLSGAIYWTDSLYNWITVAYAGREEHDTPEYYKHIWTTGLDKPHGIAVHPRKGYLFWNDWGSVPKIERSTLHGTDRVTLVKTSLSKPQGMTIDYETDILYWVDDYRDTIEFMPVEGGFRRQFKVHQHNDAHGHIFGITISLNFIFITDQTDNTIKIYNKNDHIYRGMVILHNNVPYDIMMYDEHSQPRNNERVCSALKCEHFCVSTADQQGKCLCSEGYELTDDNIHCKERKHLNQPSYVYSSGNAICRTNIQLADKEASDDETSQTEPLADYGCIIEDVGHVTAMGFDAHAELLFYADDEKQDIRRHRQIKEDEAEVLAVQTGRVRGLAVDWLTGNLFWADSHAGTINLMDTEGRYPVTILDSLDNPRGIAVNPLNGKLYWSSPNQGSINTANLDGSGMHQFQDNCVQPDGMTVVPQNNRLYWVEDTHGILSKDLDGRDLKMEMDYQENRLRDVAIFSEYIAWTSGNGKIFFGVQHRPKPDRGLTHNDLNVTHDIIAYSSINQPLALSHCDDENGGCDQLCVPISSNNRTCLCTYGYHIVNNTKCVSDLVYHSFILFVDPYHKNIYQIDTTEKTPKLHARALHTAEFPHRFTFDPHTGRIYWVDRYAHVIKYSHLINEEEEDSVAFLSERAHVTALAHSAGSGRNHLYFADKLTQTIHYIDLNNETAEPESYATDVDVNDMVVDWKDKKLYWSHKGTPGETGGIYRGDLDGTNQELVAAHVLEVTAMAYNNEAGTLFWCDQTDVYSLSKTSATDFDDPYLIISDPKANFTNIAAINGKIYVTHFDKKQVFLLSYKKSTGWQQIPMTEGIFSRITDIAVDLNVKPHFNTNQKIKDPNIVKLIGDDKEKSFFESSMAKIILGAVGGFLILLIICVILGMLLKKSMEKEKKPKDLKPSDAELNAHDNPTYATVERVDHEPVYTVLGATGGSEGAELPDVVSFEDEKKIPFDEMKESDEVDEKSFIASGIKAEPDDQTENAYSTGNDKEHLVDTEEVQLNVGKARTASVSYSSQSSKE